MVLDVGDLDRFVVRREIGFSDVVEIVEGGDGGVDFNDDFVGYLYEFGGCVN